MFGCIVRPCIYSLESRMSYVPPHLRNRPQSAAGGPPPQTRSAEPAVTLKPTQLSDRSAWWGTEHAIVEGVVRAVSMSSVRAARKPQLNSSSGGFSIAARLLLKAPRPAAELAEMPNLLRC